MVAVGWVGLGKLGGPCSAALAYYGGHDVLGYDVVEPAKIVEGDLPRTPIALTVTEIVQHTDDVVYVAVQTPHSPEFGGEYPVTDDVVPEDFEYAYLVNAVAEIAHAARELEKTITIVIVSTVLPGTCNRLVRPLLNSYTRLVYHPFFIAMGTVVDDFTRPEFVLLGADNPADSARVTALYDEMHESPRHQVSIESAELAKVAYNTFITMKIVFANTLAEMCDATGADVDEVTDALALGTQRIVSPAYLRAGMGDGGACHPRDNIALSALAERHQLSVNLMGYMVMARQTQTQWHASIIAHWLRMTSLPLVILGKTYKPGVASTAGSPALLLASELSRSSIPFTHIDHMVDDSDVTVIDDVDRPRVFFIATQHDIYADLDYPRGSVVIDPFGYVRRRAGVTLVTPGRKRHG